jgi:hypothetical protein
VQLARMELTGRPDRKVRRDRRARPEGMELTERPDRKARRDQRVQLALTAQLVPPVLPVLPDRTT